MHDGPDYLAAWLGITRIGAIAALINTNLVGESLAHGIRVASAKGIVVSEELAPSVAAIRSSIDSSTPCWVVGGSVEGMVSIDTLLQRQSPATLTAVECPLPSTRERALYIYTSGTTGLPEAAVVSHHRVLHWAYWFDGQRDTREYGRQ